MRIFQTLQKSSFPTNELKSCLLATYGMYQHLINDSHFLLTQPRIQDTFSYLKINPVRI